MSVTGTIRAAIAKARNENEVLERLDAYGPLAKARELLLAEIEEAIAEDGQETISAEEAANMTGANIETVRRAVRNGEIPDLRSNPRGTMRVRTADLDYLRGKARRQAPANVGAMSPAVAALARLG